VKTLSVGIWRFFIIFYIFNEDGNFFVILLVRKGFGLGKIVYVKGLCLVKEKLVFH